MDVTDLIGIPFKYGARGPEAYDCYGLVKHLLLTEQGIQAPDYIGYSEHKSIIAAFHSAFPFWEQYPLKPGVILLFRVPGAFHVGYALDHYTFIHTWEQSGGVCIERISDWRDKLKGCYKYVGN